MDKFVHKHWNINWIIKNIDFFVIISILLIAIFVRLSAVFWIFLIILLFYLKNTYNEFDRIYHKQKAGEIVQLLLADKSFREFENKTKINSYLQARLSFLENKYEFYK